jgi:Mn-containing catalase
MHQNQWLAAIKELEAQENVVVPSTFPMEKEKSEVAYTFIALSDGEESSKGRWAKGRSMDGLAEFQYLSMPGAWGSKPVLSPAPPALHNTPPSVK